MSNHSFTHLDVWKKAHQLVLAIYKMSARFPADERYVLTSQIRSAAISIPANIAEGYGRRTPHDKARFYTISKGSAEELSYFLILTKDLKYLSECQDVEALLYDVSGMLRRLIDATLS